MRKSLVKILFNTSRSQQQQLRLNLAWSYLEVWLKTFLMFAYTNTG